MTSTQATPISFPGMTGTWTPNHLTICSVFPEKLEKQLPLRIMGATNKDGKTPFFTTFVLDAAPTDGYSVVHVPDGFEFIRDVSQLDRHQMRDAPVPASLTADRLVRHWAGDALGAKEGLTIGVGIIKGDVPTEEELKALRTMQDSYDRFLIQDANTKWAKDDTRDQVTSRHRDAARRMGDEGFPWFKMPTHRQHKKCRACAEDILKEALVCKHCNTNLPSFYKTLGIMPTEEEDAAVLTVLKAMQPLPTPEEPAQIQAKIQGQEDKETAKN